MRFSILPFLGTLAAFTTGCNQEFVFRDVEAYYRSPGNMEVTFRVADVSGDAPDLGKGNPREKINKMIGVLENGEPLSRAEGFSDPVWDPKNVVLKILLVLDVSGSVANREHFPELKKAARTFIDKTVYPGSRIQVGIKAFDGSPSLIHVTEFSNDRALLHDAISQLEGGKDPSTNLHGAIVNSYRFLSGVPRLEDELLSKGLVIFTDGKDRAGRVSEQKAAEAISSAVSEFSHVSAVTVGSEISISFLEKFGPKDHGYFLVSDYQKLSQAFDLLSTRMDRLAKSYFSARICSPKRKGVNFLTLTLPSRENKDFTKVNFEFFADGFHAGCDVRDETQWNKPSGERGRWAPQLSEQDIVNSRAFFTRFGNLRNWVYFKSEAVKPADNFVSNFSPYSGNSSVACHLEFAPAATSVPAETVMPIIRQHSFVSRYSDTNERFQGFTVVMGWNKAEYALHCRPIDAAIKMASKKQSDYDPEYYHLEKVVIYNQ